MADYHKHLHQLYPLSKPPWKREAVEVETSDPHDCGDPACKGYREWQKYKMADELFRASALALGFTINFRQTVKDWQRFPEVAVLFSKITDIVTRYRAVVQGGPSHE